MVTLLMTSESETPFHSEDSIRQLPWSLSSSLLAWSIDAAGGAVAGERRREQAGMFNTMRTTKTNGSHFMAPPPIHTQARRVSEGTTQARRASEGNVCLSLACTSGL